MQIVTLQPGESVTVQAIGSGPIPPDPPQPPIPVPGTITYELEVPAINKTKTMITQGVRTNDTVLFTFVAPVYSAKLKQTCTFISGPITGMQVKFSDVAGDFTDYETMNYIALRCSTCEPPQGAPMVPGRRYYLNIRFENPQDNNNADLSMQFTHYG